MFGLGRKKLQSKVFGVAATYDADEHLFTVAPNRIGFGFMGPPLSGSDATTAGKVNLLLNQSFPTGSALQMTLWTSPDIESPIRNYQAQRPRHSLTPELKAVTDDRVAFLRKGTSEAVDPISGIRLHNLVLVFSVTVPIASDVPNEREMIAMRELRESFQQTLRSIGFRMEALLPTHYVRLMQTILNHGPDAHWRTSAASKWDEQVPLYQQLLDPDTALVVDDRGLWLGPHARAKTLSMRELPKEVAFGQAVAYVANLVDGARGIRHPLIISCNVLFPDAASARGRLERDQQLSKQQLTMNSAARYVAGYKERADSADIAMQAASEGDRMVQFYMGFIVFGEDEDDATRGSAAVAAYFSEMQMRLMEDHYMVLGIFSQLMPFSASPDLSPLLERYRRLPTRNVAALAPLMGAWRGTGTPLITAFGRDGQLMSISPFDASGGYNVVVIASTGSGKSFLMNEMTINARACGVRVITFDVGDSYKNLSEVLGGSFIDLDRDHPICVNPFPLVRDILEDADMLVGLISVMAAPQGGLDDFQVAAVKERLVRLFGELGRGLTIDHIAEDMRSDPERRIADVGSQLFSFTSKGDFGRFFNGPNTANLDNPYVVIELKNLKSVPHLQRVVLMMMMYQANQAVFDGDVAERKMIIVDEAWELLASDQCAWFMTTMYRRGRKSNASIVTITQSAADYSKGAGAGAMVENSSNKYLLRQRPEGIAAAKSSKSLELGEYGFSMLQTLTTEPGAFAEILFQTDYGMGVGKLIVSQWQQLLFSTSPADKAAIARRRALGMGVDEAIRDVLAERHGSGARRSRAA